MKKILILSVLVLFAITLTWSAGQEEAATATDEPTVLRVGLAHSKGHPLVDAWEDFASILNEKSDGRYEVEFFLNSQLGDKKTHMTMLQTGSLDMWMIMGGFISDYGAELVEVMMLPYLFDNVEHARAVHQSPIGQKVLDDIQASGAKVVGIGMFQEASRNFFFTDREVTSIDDMKNLKIRAQAGSIYEALLESFGGSVVPVAFSELYSALQTGVVDGAEQPYSGYFSKKFYEVAPYYLLDGHETSPNYVLFSELSWNSIPGADKALIKDSMAEAIENFNAVSESVDEKIIAEMKAEGVIFLEPDNIDEWKNAAAPLYEEFAPGYGDLIEQIKNTSY